MILDLNSLQTYLTPIRDSFLEPSLLEIYFELEKNNIWKNNWRKLNEKKIWKELCFCLLSGNVAFELVKSVISVLDKKGFLDYNWIIQETKSKELIFNLFNEPNFTPKKKDGTLRKYRYPQKRSEAITKAAHILYSDSSIKEVLETAVSDSEIRNFLASTVPGIGIKESSHFLRNIGYSNTLAIIDVHVLNFLIQNNFVSHKEVQTITPSKYEKLEVILQNLAEFHGLNLGILDLAIWHHMRNQLL